MPYSATIGVSVAIGSAVAAFLLAYLWTSIRVRELLEDSERESQGGVVGNNEGRGKTDSRNTPLQTEAPSAVPGEQVIQNPSPAPGDVVAPGSKVGVT